VLFATEKFRKENPKTYKAFQAALKEAAQFASANPEKAADTYLRVTGAKLDRDFLIKVIKNPDVQFKLEPQNTYALAEFMHKVGAIKNAPASWRDYFFDDPVTAQGS
jgi:NitT/TauT family transport system substrate-binding protein